MNLEHGKALVRRFIEEVFLAGSADAVDELAAEDVAMHTPAGTRVGRDELKRAIERAKSLAPRCPPRRGTAAEPSSASAIT